MGNVARPRKNRVIAFSQTRSNRRSFKRKGAWYEGPQIVPLIVRSAGLAGCLWSNARNTRRSTRSSSTRNCRPRAAEPTATPRQLKPHGSTSAEAVPTNVPTPTPGISTVGSGATKIVWWHISTVADQRANWANLADDYVKAHPDVSIEITVLENEAFKSKLATAMQSGSPPDIFQSWGGGVLKQYADAGLVKDLTPSLQEAGWGESFQPGPLSLYTFDGKSYGVPWNAGMIGFWYNKALFEQAGVTTHLRRPGPNLLETVKKLKAANITPIAVGEKDKWPGHFWWVYLATRIGGQAAFEKAYNRQGTFADPSFVEAGTRLKELVDLQPFQNGFLGAGYGDQQAVMGEWQSRDGADGPLGSRRESLASPKMSMTTTRTWAGSRSRPSRVARATRRTRSAVAMASRSARTRRTQRSTSCAF